MSKKKYEQTILEFMSGKGYSPLTAKKLFERLTIPENQLENAKAALKQLVDAGEVEREGRRYKLPGGELITGVIRVHPRGFGFIEDVFIPKSMLAGAVDGDTVQIEVIGESEKGYDGEVLKIIKRGRASLAGTIVAVGPKGPAIAFSPLLGPNREVRVTSKKRLKRGDRVSLEVESWDEPVKTKLTRIIGHIDDPACDIEAACEEFDLIREFPKKALGEAEKFGPKVPVKGRKDFRDLPCVTIDPTSARDYDDAITISKDKKGQFELIVHIADVSHYVVQGSALDKSARERCNSTYFPGMCVPMLPASLSNELCSLKPDVDRLAASVVMQFNRKGELKDYEIVRSVIRSKKRFTYEEAMQVLDGKKKSPHKAMLKLMVELCELLKGQRRERGSVEFALPEAAIQVNDKGEPTGTQFIEYDITHQMIEEFALKANEVVATHLTKQGRGLTYRVHEAPTDQDLEGFFQLAATFGYKLPKKPAMEDLQTLFDKARETPHGAQLAVSFIRSMKLAIYSTDNVGHYGLSLEHYCHFTSPIRRYSDLVVHRVLFDKTAYTEKEIKEIALACSTQERISSRAENSVLRLKKLRYLEKFPDKKWKAVITSVKPFGIVFEVEELMLEGFVHISEVGDDYYLYNESRGELKGRRSGETFTTGSEVLAIPHDIDLITSEAKWDIVG